MSGCLLEASYPAGTDGRPVHKMNRAHISETGQFEYNLRNILQHPSQGKLSLLDHDIVVSLYIIVIQPILVYSHDHLNKYYNI